MVKGSTIHLISKGQQDLYLTGDPKITFWKSVYRRHTQFAIETIRNNFNIVLHTLEWARANNTPVLFSGSSTLHHGLWGSPYAWSKYGGEQLCELYSKVYDLPTAICRFYNVYGEHQLEDGAYATVVGIFEKQYRENKPLTITGDGEQRRDFTHIDDIVDGIVRCGTGLLGDNPVSRGQAYEVGRGKNFSINELADMFDKERILNG